jgi:negative regulator of flagellin synthesis FlgM
MTNVNGIVPTQGPQPIQTNSSGRASSSPAAKTPASDTVEISSQARIAAKLAALPDVRSDLVARVKSEIAAGTYDTPEKMNVALDRMLNEL